MKTILHYQLKDFVKFVLDNLEKRGYVMADGCAPEMTNMDDYDDPEQVVMEALVEDRPEVVFNQVAPAALPDPAPVTKNEKPKSVKAPSEKELTRRAKLSVSMKKVRAEQKVGKQTGVTEPAMSTSEILSYLEEGQDQEVEPDPDPRPGWTIPFQKDVLQSIEELRHEQEVVAAAPLPFSSNGASN